MPTLYIAATDIGNREDNTFRLKEYITKADFVIVESFKEGSKLLRYFNIKKEMIELNEHTKQNELEPLVHKIMECEIVVLISDCGAPLLEDPGYSLIEYCYNYEINVSVLPGVSSVTAAIMLTPFPMKEFYYAGLLPRNNKERENKLLKLKKLNVPIIILDTPYRISSVLSSSVKVFGSERNAIICLDITSQNEEILYSSLSNIEHRYKDVKKREFVLIVDS